MIVCMYRICRISKDKVVVTPPPFFGRGYIFDRIRRLVSVRTRFLGFIPVSKVEIPFSDIVVHKYDWLAPYGESGYTAKACLKMTTASGEQFHICEPLNADRPAQKILDALEDMGIRVEKAHTAPPKKVKPRAKRARGWFRTGVALLIVSACFWPFFGMGMANLVNNVLRKIDVWFVLLLLIAPILTGIGIYCVRRSSKPGVPKPDTGLPKPSRRTGRFWWGVVFLICSAVPWYLFVDIMVKLVYDRVPVTTEELLITLLPASIFTWLGVWCVRRGIKTVVAGEGVPPAGEQVIYERKVALHSWTLGSWGPGGKWLRLTPQSIFIEEEPEIPLASIKSCEIKTGPYVNLQFADSLGKTKRVKLFIPAFLSGYTGPQVEEVYDAIMRARGVKE